MFCNLNSKFFLFFRRDTKISYISFCMRPSYCELTLKQEVYKLNIFIIKLFNISIKHMSKRLI